MSLASNYGNVNVDWFEDDSAHVFKLDLPGLKATDVRVQVVAGDTLQIAGVRKGDENAYGKWHVKERPTGSFFRRFSLPSFVRPDDITAYDENGVLVVTVPKKKPLLKTIPISML